MRLVAWTDDRPAQFAAAVLVTVGALGASFVLHVMAGTPEFPMPSTAVAPSPASEQHRTAVQPLPTPIVTAAPAKAPAVSAGAAVLPRLAAATAIPAATVQAAPAITAVAPTQAAPAEMAAAPVAAQAASIVPTASGPAAASARPATEALSARPTPEARLWRIGRTGGAPAYVRAAPRPDAAGGIWPAGTILEDGGQSAASGGQLWRAVRTPDGEQGWTSTLYLVAVRTSTGARP